MKFERLRLAGFKTFVDPTEIVIAPGLTGIVGPNGCGKSNLVEAMRWVMGETSSKSLRGGGMDDVIFAGSGNRPERNHAEVSIRIADPPKDMPGHLAGAESLEIARKIVRDSGSTFRMNGREVRARDVQIFFADAASGARSPSLVRQGQIGEIISAKPQHRRRILEDAAGVAGLHARRHEAELRLKAAEDNLVRAEDILGQLDRQIGELRRQARQAERYKALQQEIRALDLALLARALDAARVEKETATRAHAEAIRAIAAATVAQGETERARAVSEHELEALRAAAGEAARRLQGLLVAREALDSEVKLVDQRLSALSRRREELARDHENAAQIMRDATEARARLAEEDKSLLAAIAAGTTERESLSVRLAATQMARQEAEASLLAARTAQAEVLANHRAAQQRLAEAASRVSRLTQEAELAAKRLAESGTANPAFEKQADLQLRLDALAGELEAEQKVLDSAEQAAREARQSEQGQRPKLAEAERLLQRLETEARTIRKMVEDPEPGLWTRAIDRITVQPGYEMALSASLGDDLDAGIDGGAPRLWSGQGDGAGPGLPDGVRPLGDHVDAPPALALRLAQIGIVDRAEGAALQPRLKQGQRLVSREGDLWRWDGFIARAEAPSPAARRLAERNRLVNLEREAADARRKRDEARDAMDRAIRLAKAAGDAEQSARDTLRRLLSTRELASAELQREARRNEEARLALESMRLRSAALTADRDEAETAHRMAAAALAALPEPIDAGAGLAAMEATLAVAREQENAARAAEATGSAMLDAASRRREAVTAEMSAWQQRAERADRTLAEHRERVARVDEESQALEDMPARLLERRRSITGDITQAETESRAAADALASGETAFRKADEAARQAFQALAAARESAARLEAAVTHADERLEHVTRTIETTLEGPLALLDARRAEDPIPAELDAAAIERRLIDLKHDRDKLGLVNLRADIELAGIEGDKERLTREREEFTAAIAKFRRAIETLNGEARARLKTSFEVVNAHFKTLFGRLFGGGSAELHLVEADDPLEAGLEIIAKPPGKKPQLLSLLSGGEQALTATALIFAVFLTNPSPICVLDEVDAPLDDSNVERLCDLLVDMARDTATRFLVITHNPISMARMDRLYGVTMVERGVSQLVSVDLAAAEKLAEAS